MALCARRRRSPALPALPALLGLLGLVLVAAVPAGATTTPPAAVTGTPVPGTAGAQLTGVACPTAADCWAVGQRTGATAPALVVSTRDGGRRWRTQVIRPATLGTAATATLSLSGVSCADARSCMAVGAVTAPLPGGAVAVTSDGRHWDAALGPPGDNALVAVHCSAPGDCIVLALTGTTLFSATTTDGGATWQRGGALPAGFGGASSLSCPVAGTCAVAGYTATTPGRGTGAVAVTHDGGATWQPASVPAGTGVLHGVSCSTAHCVAVGSGSTVTTAAATGSGAVLDSTDGGVTFTARPASPAADDWLDVDCAPASAPATTGTTGTTAGAAPPAVCAVVGIHFTHAIPPVPLSAVAATVEGGTTVRSLTQRYVPAPLAAVTCPVTGRCVAVGGSELATVALPTAATLRTPRRDTGHRSPGARGATTTG